MSILRPAVSLVALGLAACAGYGLGRSGAPETLAAAAETPKPAYLIVTGVVHDREAFGAGYAAKLPPLYEKYGGRYLAVGRNAEFLEGEARFESFALAEWPSVEAARAFWNSPEYVEIRKARIDGNWGEFDVALIEGLAAPAQVSPLGQEALGE